MISESTHFPELPSHPAPDLYSIGAAQVIERLERFTDGPRDIRFAATLRAIFRMHDASFAISAAEDVVEEAARMALALRSMDWRSGERERIDACRRFLLLFALYAPSADRGRKAS